MLGNSLCLSVLLNKLTSKLNNNLLPKFETSNVTSQLLTPKEWMTSRESVIEELIKDVLTDMFENFLSYLISG